ncbi:MAG: hypothetical protein D6715_12130 [Calditrichaeota bacterium]|nr:MAG: hypothetical protein D6715_12130 [Calditrichota bacterium]
MTQVLRQRNICLHKFTVLQTFYIAPVEGIVDFNLAYLNHQQEDNLVFACCQRKNKLTEKNSLAFSRLARRLHWSFFSESS